MPGSWAKTLDVDNDRSGYYKRCVRLSSIPATIPGDSSMNIPVLGAARFPSPLKHWVDESERVPDTILRTVDARPQDGLLFELAGARERLFFNPPDTRAGIVTCGGICPGLNDVIRSLFLELHHAYGVKEVLGFRWGYQGLDPDHG